MVVGGASYGSACARRAARFSSKETPRARLMRQGIACFCRAGEAQRTGPHKGGRVERGGRPARPGGGTQRIGIERERPSRAAVPHPFSNLAALSLSTGIQRRRRPAHPFPTHLGLVVDGQDDLVHARGFQGLCVCVGEGGGVVLVCFCLLRVEKRRPARCACTKKTEGEHQTTRTPASPGHRPVWPACAVGGRGGGVPNRPREPALFPFSACRWGERTRTPNKETRARASRARSPHRPPRPRSKSPPHPSLPHLDLVDDHGLVRKVHDGLGHGLCVCVTCGERKEGREGVSDSNRRARPSGCAEQKRPTPPATSHAPALPATPPARGTHSPSVEAGGKGVG
jgi:hypothetical protein